ncbi:MAG: glycosyltransferase [Chloroflexi bacterium]|nr:glycosyltransferase [Chloroflexota bacterium]
MKVLLLTPDIPFPSESGAAIRNWGIICGLAEAGHELTLLSFSDRAPDVGSEPLSRRCHAVHTVPLPRRSRTSRIAQFVMSSSADMEFRLASNDFEATLQELLRKGSFDIVQFSGLELGGYLGVIEGQKRGAKLVYDALNAEADLQRVIAGVDSGSRRRLPAALYSRAQTKRLARFEERICRRVDAIIAVSEEDRALLRGYAGAPITVMSNGIHTRDYLPPVSNERSRGQLVFTGKMDYRPNVDAIEWFCSDVLPSLRRRVPEIQITVVGRNPHWRLQELVREDSVQVIGWVESVLPYLHQAAVYVVPLRMGSGTRLKILQAMAAGCAVVATTIGAAGLNDETRGAIMIADDATAFAEAIFELLEDDRRRATMGELARQQVLAHYDWKVLMPALLQVYERLGGG